MKWDATLYNQKHSFVFRCGEELLGILNPQPGERILDAGCGTGHLTQRIADAGAEVVGIDSSWDMIGAARAAHPEVSFIVADVADFFFDKPFDVIFSNAALHWVLQSEHAFFCRAEAL